jgi:hypothetical protein
MKLAQPNPALLLKLWRSCLVCKWYRVQIMATINDNGEKGPEFYANNTKFMKQENTITFNVLSIQEMSLVHRLMCNINIMDLSNLN